MSFIFFLFFLPSALPCQTLLFLPLTICLSFVHPIFVSLWKLTWENVLFSTLRSSSYKKRRRDRRKCQLRGGPPLSAVNTNGSSLCRQIMRFVVSSEAPSFVSWFCFPRRVNRRELGKRCCPFSSFGSSFFSTLPNQPTQIQYVPAICHHLQTMWWRDSVFRKKKTKLRKKSSLGFFLEGLSPRTDGRLAPCSPSA